MTDAHVEKPDVPDVLYRGFKVLEHARAFVDEGIIRFGRLDMYRNLEDPRRRDPEEGIARLRMPMTDSQDVADVISTECKGRNWTYVLCCSAADQGYVASKFGRYVVRINNPGELIADIRDHLSSNPLVPNPSVDPRWVTYDRGAAATRSLDADELLTLSYSQKSASFVDDQEFRIAILSLLSREGPAADPIGAWAFVSVELHRRLSYCDLLED
jgi:hypothetical protein